MVSPAEPGVELPLAYLQGELEFRGRRFKSDRRAYITDPELTWLVDRVLVAGDVLGAHLGRMPRLLEFGVGGGALAISIKLERPQWSLCGVDIDGAALALAHENATAHGADIRLDCVDLCAHGAALDADLIFGDPPWGGDQDLYDGVRSAAYYAQMPAGSAFPGGDGPTAVHDQLLQRLVAADEAVIVALNYGVLAPALVERSAQRLPSWRALQPVPGLRLVVGANRSELASLVDRCCQ